MEDKHTMVIDTVDDLKRNFTKREIAAADVARRMYVTLGRPSPDSFENIIRRGQILNNPVTISDYRNALTIYGKDLGSIKGKTTRSKPHHVQVESGSPEKLRIVLSVDSMHFIGINFLITVSRNFRFITAGVLPDRKRVTIFNAIQHVINIYKGKRHDATSVDFTELNGTIHSILADNEFESLWEDIEEFGVEVNVTAKEEHVPEVERQNHVIKERARAIIQTLPYRNMPRKMRIGLIYYVVFWLNSVAKEGQDFSDFSARDLIFGERKIDYNIMCKIPFGTYVQVHDDPSIMKTMDSRTTGAISLGLTSNIQGTHKFLSLRTGEIIVRRKWTELPVPAEVIDKLDDMTTDKSDFIDSKDNIEDNATSIEDKLEDALPDEPQIQKR